MLKVNFYETVNDDLLNFAVIVAKHNGKWVLCKHRNRNTYEIPGGHREETEKINETAKRELYEETGAIEYSLKPICVYAVEREKGESFGMVYFADITKFEKILTHEIEKIEFFEELPSEWTYPLIQPLILEKVANTLDL